jgi:putative tryptophan/tyrosine transport system substrate-binding protein
MRRREFIAGLGAVAAWPLAALGQLERVRHIGVLMAYEESDPEAQTWMAAFRDGLRKLGWMEGRNILIDYRWIASNLDAIEQSAKEVVALQPDLILASGTPVTASLLQQTRVIPIVFVTVADPIGMGFVESLAHPAGNITGFINLESSLGNKWPQLLKEIAPGITHANIMFNPTTAPYADFYARPFLASGPTLGLTLDTAPVRNDADIEAAVGALAREPGGGLVVMPDGFTTSHRATIISFATRHRLPAIYPDRFYAVDGGLMSYGVDFRDIYRRASQYVDRILKGDKPADLPVQQPTHFALVINLKAAKALGLAVPDKLLALADEVIE